MGIFWSIIIGSVAGIIAKVVMLGDKEPSGFILTLGQCLRWYGPGQDTGLIGAAVGAIIDFAVREFVRRRASSRTLAHSTSESSMSKP